MMYNVIIRIKENSLQFAEEYVTVAANDVKGATEAAFVLIHNKIKDRHNCRRPIQSLLWSIDHLAVAFKYDYNMDCKDLNYLYHFTVTEVNVLENGV